MDSVFSKNREKRPRASTESNNSFVKNVTSRVSGLLPATIAKWFSSPSSSNANGSPSVQEVTDSSTEDEGPESPTALPPAKRIRYGSSPGNKVITEKNVEVIPEPEISHSTSVLYNSIQSLPGRNTFRRETNYVSTPLRSPSEEMKPDKGDRDTPTKQPQAQQQLSVSSIQPSVTQKRKSIFESTQRAEEYLKACAKTANNTLKDPKRPCFKPSLFGSPFYPGNTMYGGASSTYINQPNIRQRKTALVNESKDNDNVSMSSSARRVLDLLENYSSPLVDARRIPIIRTPKTNESFSSDSTLPSTSKSLTYPHKTQELHVPSIANLLRLKQRTRLMNSTKVARQIIASHSSTISSYQPYTMDSKRDQLEQEEAQSKSTSKLKTRLTRRNRVDDTFDMPKTVELPTGVLQINEHNLPKFTFGSSAVTTATVSKTTFTQTNSADLKSSSAFSRSTSQSNPSSDMFKFSNPIKISDPQQSEKTPPKYVFGSPERSVDKEKLAEKNKIAESPITTFNSNKIESPAIKSSNTWSCSDCWVSNKADATKCVCCGGKPPSKDAKCDNPAKVETQKTQGISVIQFPTKKTANKWECDSCWVGNDESAAKCVCCGNPNPKKAGAPPAKQLAEKDWKCGDCWISNKSSVEKCAACGGAKPNAKTNEPAPPSSLPVSKFTETIKTQKTGKWSCPTCLVSNDNDKTRCVCCETEKNGAEKEASKKLFNFSTNANPTFKFGIDPKTQISNLQKQSEETPKPSFAKPMEESETNNNVVPKIPSFTFTLPAKKSTENVDAKADTAKPAFTFGIPKQSLGNTIPKHDPISPVKLPELKPIAEKPKENPQEVPKIDFKLPTQDAPKTTGFFTPPASINSTQNSTPPAFSSFLNSSSGNEKKELMKSPLTFTGESKPQVGLQNTFTFSASSAKSGIGMFNMPTSTAAPATCVSFGTSNQNSTTTSAAPTLSLFQKPETNSSSLSMLPKSDLTSSAPVNLFQSAETTTAQPLPAPAAPVFSFGNTGQGMAATPEKPKFNFTFGSSNTNESSTLFKPPAFGATPDNSANKFSIQSGGILGGNTLGSNTLSNNTLGGNPLGGNTLGSNTLGGNTLGGNTLGGNTLGGNTLGGNTLGGNTLGGNTLGGNTLGSNPLGGNTLGGNTLGGNTLGGNKLGGNTLGGNTLGGNTLTGNQLGGNTLGTGLTPGNASTFSGSGNTLGGSGMSGNPLTGGNDLTNAGMSGSGMQTGNLSSGHSMFGSPAPKENMWSNNTAGNVFAPSSTPSSMQKPAPFTFGAPTPFNAGNPAANAQPTPNLFGANPQPTANVFGMPAQSSPAQPSLFPSQPQSQPAPNIFGSQPAQSAPAPMGMFGASNVASPPAFGAANQAMPSFETPSIAPAAAPAFNFGAPQAQGVFGFGQQPQQQGVYSFGGGAPAPQQLQFSMGSAPATTRRVRKAVRRNQQR